MQAIKSQTTKIRKTTTWITMLSLIPHMLCCGIPVTAALIGLGTTIGLGAALASNPIYALVDAYHPVLLGIAVSGVFLSGVFNLIAYNVDCKAVEDSCAHESCKPKKLKSFRIFLISLFLLVLDISWFLAEAYLLQTH